MGPIPKGTHRRVCVSPRFSTRGRSVLQKCEARMHSIQTESVCGWTLSMQRFYAWMPFI
jgi:hypothetical protein